ncbi:hypothetical protein [Bradyrhizobium centrosematis]|uniref:hypothetical protein n=1 Tax=Bradyrhizobium centrosematis TaxID=1300039 RepID=UPI00216957D5|nr:hypothetical protein [Bradyrhizobium centrosematis]MCS3761108.1 hypothetical protein [Bradyrhizobium centrosematis]MCS3771004.1 hypothetical protein [Bradyrhizobium centrosematis]
MTSRHHGIIPSLNAICLLGLLAPMVASTAMAQPASAPSGMPPLMDRETEVAMALSACPPAVASKAAVYVLEKSGYVKIRDSENGFTALVQHSMPTSQEPECLDAEGARSHLPRMLKVAELRGQGKSPEEIRRFMADGLIKGMFRPPTRPGIIYMLSKENIVPDSKGGTESFPPHVMFYAPYLTNADLGSGGEAEGGAAFVAGEGSPFALIIVPVPAQTGSGHAH